MRETTQSTFPATINLPTCATRTTVGLVYHLGGKVHRCDLLAMASKTPESRLIVLASLQQKVLDQGCTPTCNQDYTSPKTGLQLRGSRMAQQHGALKELLLTDLGSITGLCARAVTREIQAEIGYRKLTTGQGP